VSELVSAAVRDMTGDSALPRANGELVFDAPWQGRVLGAAIGAVRGLGLEWDEFRTRLMVAIDANPGRPYYDSWTEALESLITDLGLATSDHVHERALQVEP
jgi:hypothetical protein